MTSRRTRILFLTALLIASCSADGVQTGVVEIHNPHDGIWQDAPEVPFRFVLEQTFGVSEKPEKAILAGVGPTIVDDDQNVYVFDSRASNLVSFDRNGSFRWRAGSAGEGPGEFNLAFGGMIADGEGLLYILNQRWTRVDVFDTSGTFVTTRGLDRLQRRQPFLVGFLDLNRLLLSYPLTGAFGLGFDLISTEAEWTRLAQFEVDQSGDLSVPGGLSAAPIAELIDGDIAVGNVGEYRIEFLDPSGKLKRVMTRDFDEYVRPGLYQGPDDRRVRQFSNITRVLAVGAYRLVFAFYATNVPDPDAFVAQSPRDAPAIAAEKTIDLFDANWTLLYSWVAPSDEHPAPSGFHAIDASDRLYFDTDAPFPQLGRYRLEVTPPN
jgi:hypothetical protein